MCYRKIEVLSSKSMCLEAPENCAANMNFKILEDAAIIYLMPG